METFYKSKKNRPLRQQGTGLHIRRCVQYNSQLYCIIFGRSTQEAVIFML